MCSKIIGFNFYLLCIAKSNHTLQYIDAILVPVCPDRLLLCLIGDAKK
jgi:hypothetical protein